MVYNERERFLYRRNLFVCCLPEDVQPPFRSLCGPPGQLTASLIFLSTSTPWQAQYFDVQYSTNSNVLGPNVRSELVAPILGDVGRVAQIDRRRPFREASLSTVPYTLHIHRSWETCLMKWKWSCLALASTFIPMSIEAILSPLGDSICKDFLSP